VNKQNLTHDMILGPGTFNASVLTEETPFEVFTHFGFQSGRTVNKFADCEEPPRSPNGLIYLPNYTNAYISGSEVSATDLGTHTLFLADVTDGEVLSDAPSASYAFYHAHIKPQPVATEKKGWRCKICGYIYEGDTLPEDYICPLCKHGAADFEPA
jgi:flavin reductase (DIM6/NTAB) family NADH-FMN oxidoreductase RutF